MRTDLDKMYESYEKGELNLKEFIDKIIEAIFLEPHRFGIGKLDSDLKSEFIVYLLEKLQTYIIRYSKKLSIFSSYIISLIYNLKKAWIREFYHKQAHKQSINYYIGAEEPKYVLAEHDYAYNEEAKAHKQHINFSDKDKLIILLLALKSFYYLEDSHISHVSKVTGIPINDIHELIHNLSLLCEKRRIINTKKREKLNSSFIKKNRFSLELMNIDRDSSLAYNLNRSYVFHAKQWKNNLKLYNEAPAVKPSNANIAELLQIKECKVYHILKDSKEKHAKGLPVIGEK